MRLNYSKGLLSALMLVLFAGFALAQSVLTGTVVDGDEFPISGAEVMVEGTDIVSMTDEEGFFSVSVEAGEGLLKVSDAFSGSQEISYVLADGETKDLGTISLSEDGVALSDIIVVGKGIIDIAENRKTPIASTVISGKEIQERAVGNVEFPEAMKNTPNVYVTNQAGGFGDGQMFTRGFDQSNTAFLLNGQPINGMEDGKMYWSNWSGMGDIANAIDIQRGLGSSKLAISSVGGTINIVTKATDKKQGGFARFLVGNDSYFKGTLGYNTGLMDNGWGLSVMVDHWQGHRSWAAHTAGQGQNYFLSVGKQAGDHNLNFMIFGAPQWHDQNFSKGFNYGNGLGYNIYGTKWNPNGGFDENGKAMTWRRNYYHKPVMNLNWDWNISDKSSLSTVLYGSFGRGGGTGPYGKSSDAGLNYYSGSVNLDYYNLQTGDLNFGYIKAQNALVDGGIGSYGNGRAIRGSVNNHQWYGLVTNFNHEFNDNLSLNVGADVRFYKGDHFRQLINLLGLNGWNDTNRRYEGDLDGNGQYVVSATFDANPWASLFNFASEKERIAYDNSEWINYQGAFGQLEYANDKFSAFFQGAVSNQSYKTEDRFRTDNEQSDKINRIGYNVKGGASYTLNENNQVFANAGYYSRQPFLDSLFPYGGINLRDADPKTEGNQEVENETILGFEAGYKFKMGKTQINLNGYYTKWANRFIQGSGQFKGSWLGENNDNPIDAQFNLFSMTQIHKGLELDFNSKVDSHLTFRGYMTYNDFKYDGKTPVTLVREDNNVAYSIPDITLNGTYVGEAPMFTAGLGSVLNITKNLSLNGDFNFYGKLYGVVDIAEVAKVSINNSANGTNEIYQSEKLNDYATIDAGLTYEFKFGSQALKLRGNVYNLLNHTYISRKDNYGYFFGKGRTWNASITYNF